MVFLDAVTKRHQQTRKPKELETTEGGYYRYGLSDKAFQRALITVRRHIKQGKLIPAKRVGNRAYFEKSQIEREVPF